jgi:hypothetical protein
LLKFFFVYVFRVLGGISALLYYIIIFQIMYKFEMLRIWTMFITRKLLHQEFPCYKLYLLG